MQQIELCQNEQHERDKETLLCYQCAYQDQMLYLKLIKGYQDQGNQLHEQLIYDKAVDRYNIAINITKHLMIVWTLKGDELRNQDKQEKAQKLYSCYQKMKKILLNMLNLKCKLKEAEQCQREILQLNEFHSLEQLGEILLYQMNQIDAQKLITNELKYNNLHKFQLYKVFQFYVQVQLLQSINYHEQAIEQCDMALQIDPKNILIHNLKARSLLKLGMNFEAYKQFDKVLKLQQKDNKDIIYQGISLHLTEKYEEAIKYFDQVIISKPNDFQALMNKPCLQSVLIDIKKQFLPLTKPLNVQKLINYNLNCYLSVISKKPQPYLKFKNIMKQLYRSMNQLSLIKIKTKCLNKLKQYKQAIQCYEQITIMNPQDLQCKLLIGVIQSQQLGKNLHKLEQYDLAIKQFEEVITFDPKGHKGYLSKGIILNTMKKYKEALDCFQQAEFRFSQDPQIYVNKAQTLFNMGQNDLVWEFLAKALEVKSLSYKVCVQIGNILQMMKNYDQTLRYYDKATQMKPQKDLAYFMKGKLLHFLTTFNEALECFNESREIDNQNYEYHYSKGQTLFSLQKYEEANQSFEKVIELNSQYYECYFQNGETLFKLFKYEEAINNFNKAIELNPKNYIVYYYKGIILFNKQQFQESLICYDMAIQINPQFIQSYIQKCSSLLMLQQFEAALININLALEIENQPELILQKAKLLSILYLYDDAIIACSIAEACGYDKEQCQNLLQEIEKIKFQQ